MRIRVRKQNGKWRTLYRNLTEGKAKDLMQDILKNLTANGVRAALDNEGTRITGKVEYVAQE